ncbi:MAG: NPCBM/NEW2 domain-containing protein, partial [Kiritimatiellia bacterium]|nr:NPCBM/NEW2 domain-containing protein [Kiritimatiellia bacterium]
ALFSPEGRTPLTCVETTSGLTATFGNTRFTALSYLTPSIREHFARQRAGYEERIIMHNGRLVAVVKELELARKQHSDKATELQKATAADREAREKELAKSKEELDKVTAKLSAQEKHLAALKARHAATEGGDKTWIHVIQPIWSLDCLHVPFPVINVRYSFSPNLVPLCRIRPASAVSPPFLPWRMNRNSRDQLLSSCGKDYGWGFAVHAYSELRFLLPNYAETFRSTAGIDSIVGSGGCASARVYLGSIETKPLFESPPLIGSQKTVDTGRLKLHQPLEGPIQLVLQADPAIHDAPPGADPLNIRDNLDWLDASIELDSATLQKHVQQRIGPLIACSRGWTFGADPRDIDIRTCYLARYGHTGIESSQLLALVQPLKQPLLLSRKMLIGPSEKYLAVYLSTEQGYSPGSHAVTLSVEKKQIKARKFPIRQDWQNWPSPLLFQLDEYQGRTVTLELTQRADRKPLHWRAIITSEELPLPYHFARLLEEAGHGNLQITRQLGAELRSSRMDDRGKRALISVYHNGGIIGYSGQLMRSLQTGDTHHVFVGEDWNGGDKSFEAFQKIPILESLTVVRSSGVSDSAVKNLQEVKPGLEIAVLEKLPETREQRCTFWMQNHTGKEVRLMWDSSGTLTHRDTLHSRIGRKKHHSNIGVKFEAHVQGKCVSKFTVTPGRIWNIHLEK